MISEFLLNFFSTSSVLAFSFDKTLLELLVPLYKNGFHYRERNFIKFNLACVEISCAMIFSMQYQRITRCLNQTFFD